MIPKEVIAIIAIVIIIGSALLYIIRARKKGVKCIGCPDGGSCKISDFAKDLKDAKKHICQYCNECNIKEKGQ